MGMTRDNMAPQCDSSPFTADKCQKRKRRWDVTPEDLQKEKEVLQKQVWRERPTTEITADLIGKTKDRLQEDKVKMEIMELD